MKRTTQLSLIAALLGSTAFLPAPASAATPACSQLATNPAFGLAGNPVITSATSTLVPPSGTNAAYCNVQITYSAKSGPADGYAVGQSQAIKIGIGLPLSSTDGGAGGIQGAWNGKTSQSRWWRLRWLGWIDHHCDQHSLCRLVD